MLVHCKDDLDTWSRGRKVCCTVMCTVRFNFSEKKTLKQQDPAMLVYKFVDISTNKKIRKDIILGY